MAHPLVPFGSYGPMEHPDYWATDGECPCDSPDYATGDCPIHDTCTTCGHDPCTCDQETDDARDGGL